jgi:NAD(P)-dependent dehydrogenase (short-subunit alcohol dehydrogenase family)
MLLEAGVVAIVTGGASGLGEATARHFSARGVRVAIFDFNENAGEELAREIGGVFCKTDITSDEQVEAAFAKARAALGQEHILVNCAGVGYAIKTAGRDKLTGEIRHHPLEKFERTIQVNLVGSFRCIAKAAAGMIALPATAGGERGVIVNTASVAAQDGQIGQAAYSASKAGVVGMTLPIARDLMNEGIRINTIMPGIFATAVMLASPEHVLQALEKSVPFPRRLGRPEEFAAMVETVVTSTYLNGESIRLDGAIRMGLR